MRGIDQFNFKAFDEAAANLRRNGWTVFSPAEHDRETGFDETRNTLEGFDLKQAFQWDCNRVCEADYIVLLPGWEKSTGVNAELAVAKMVGTEVRYYSPPGSLYDTWSIWKEDPFRQPSVEVLIPDLSPTGEVRVVSATGGAKGKKLAQLGALDPASLMEVAKIAGFGSTKYARMNFVLGYDWSLSYDAMQRHLHAFWNGDDYDDESGLYHIAHAAWHCLALLTFLMRDLGTDDRISALPHLRGATAD
jgi:hypothetical protein